MPALLALGVVHTPGITLSCATASTAALITKKSIGAVAMTCAKQPLLWKVFYNWTVLLSFFTCGLISQTVDEESDQSIDMKKIESK